MKTLLCWFGRHAAPIRDRSKTGERVWRCPRCLRVRPRDVETSGDPLAGQQKNRHPLYVMPAEEQWAADTRTGHIYESRDAAMAADVPEDALVTGPIQALRDLQPLKRNRR